MMQYPPVGAGISTRRLMLDPRRYASTISPKITCPTVRSPTLAAPAVDLAPGAEVIVAPATMSSVHDAPEAVLKPAASFYKLGF